MSSGPSLVFVAMTQIFETLPGGRIIGIFFFASLIFAVISTFFTILEIPRMYVQEKTHTSHQDFSDYYSGSGVRRKCSLFFVKRRT